MNFYSDKIINNIIDNEPIENIITSIDYFTAQYNYLLIKYSLHTIHYKYTDVVLNDPNNIIAFYCIDNEFLITNCPSILVYCKCKYENEIQYYILLTCTKRIFRNQGYASKLLNGFIERIKQENQNNKNKLIKIILSSIEIAVLFYEDYGFKWTRKSIIEYPLLLQYEKYEKKDLYFIMELIVSI